MKKTFIVLLTLLLSATLHTAIGAASRSLCSPISKQKTKKIFQQLAHQYQIPGAVLGMRSPCGDTTYLSYGYADLAKKIKMDDHHFFRIGSITKSFTAVATLILVDEGKLSLKQTINSLLPDQIPNSQKITVAMLLQMRSGLSDYTSNPQFLKKMEDEPTHLWNLNKLLHYVHKETAAGTTFAYRNINYRILEKIIEATSHESYETFVKKRILTPLGLKHTQIARGTTMPKHAAHGYLIVNNAVKNMGNHFDASWGGAAGNMISTAADLLTWMKALKQGKLLSPKSHTAMLTLKPGILGNDLIGYGMGWLNRRGAAGHGGNYADIYTSVLFSYHHIDFVILANGMLSDQTKDATDLFYGLVTKLLPLKHPDSWLNQQQNRLLSLLKEYLNVPGIIFLHQFPDKTLLTKSLGVAKANDLSATPISSWQGAPINPNMYFRIGSITKTMTATTMLILAQESKLSLDDHLNKWLPGLIKTGDKITIRQLLNHTSGIPDFIRNPDFFNRNYNNPLFKWQLKERVAYGTPLSEPGQNWSYSNTGYILLAMIAEKASHQTFAQLLQEKIFQPLGLKKIMVPSTFDFSMPKPYIHGYTFAFNPMQPIPSSMLNHPKLKNASISNWQGLGYGDVIAYPAELLTWLSALTKGTLLKKSMQNEMHQYITTPDGERYGLGIEESDGYVGHDGDLPGYHDGIYAKDGHLFAAFINADTLKNSAPALFIIKTMGKLMRPANTD